MRARLAVILFVPGLLLLVLLGMAYAVTVAHVNQQRVFDDRLRDASYLSLVARQSLRADDPSLVAGDLERYREVYGIRAAVLDASGATWAESGLDVQRVDARFIALSGRRNELEPAVLPWEVDRIVVAEPVFEGSDLVGAVLTSSDAGELSRGIWVSWGMLAVGGVGVVLLALVIADRTASWVLRPVRRVDRAMTEIGRGELAARIPESVGPPELHGVTSRFNEMAERVEHLMRKQQEFVHNASHELRNPLTALTLRVEELELTAPPDRVADVGVVRAEVVRLAHILEALLLLADDSRPGADPEPVDVAALVGQRVRNWRMLAGERVVAHPAPEGGVPARANATALECAVDAVIDNAVKYSSDGARVEVSVEGSEALVSVGVRDHGPGVPPDQLAQLTERSWRGPAHRTTRGSGLGLSIASELLAASGGHLDASLPEGGGLLVRLRVPRWQEDA